MNITTQITLAAMLLYSIAGCKQKTMQTDAPDKQSSNSKDDTLWKTLDQDTIVKIANNAAKEKGYSLDKYALPVVSFDSTTKSWLVRYEGIVVPSPGNFFTVLVYNEKKVIVSGGD